MKIQYIYTMQYCPVVKKNEIMIFSVKWIELAIIILDKLI